MNKLTHLRNAYTAFQHNTESNFFKLSPQQVLEAIPTEHPTALPPDIQQDQHGNHTGRYCTKIITDPEKHNIENGFLFKIDLTKIPNGIDIFTSDNKLFTPNIPKSAITHSQKIENGKIVGEEMPLQH